MSAIQVPIPDGFGKRTHRVVLRRVISHLVLQGDWEASPATSRSLPTESAGEKPQQDRSQWVQKTMPFRQAKRG